MHLQLKGQALDQRWLSMQVAWMVCCFGEMGKHRRLQERQEGGVGLRGGGSESQPWMGVLTGLAFALRPKG